jgi:type II secretory pathway pseudopilin PulG
VKSARSAGFSLLETLIVTSVIGVLIGLLMPAVQQARETANRASCLNKLRQIGTALHNYHGAHGRLPPGNAGPFPSPDPNSMLSWLALILPQIEQGNLYQQSALACRQQSNPSRNPPHVGFATVIAGYVCSSDGRLDVPQTNSKGITAAFTSYVGIMASTPPGRNARSAGVLGSFPGIGFGEIVDGMSQTLMVGERMLPQSWQAGWWYPVWLGGGDGFGPHNLMDVGPVYYYVGDAECDSARRGHFGPGRIDNPCDRYHFWSLHPGGGNWLMADASARYLMYAIAPSTLQAMATRNGGEVIPPE